MLISDDEADLPPFRPDFPLTLSAYRPGLNLNRYVMPPHGDPWQDRMRAALEGHDKHKSEYVPDWAKDPDWAKNLKFPAAPPDNFRFEVSSSTSKVLKAMEEEEAEFQRYCHNQKHYKRLAKRGLPLSPPSSRDASPARTPVPRPPTIITDPNSPWLRIFGYTDVLPMPTTTTSPAPPTLPALPPPRTSMPNRLGRYRPATSRVPNNSYQRRGRTNTASSAPTQKCDEPYRPTTSRVPSNSDQRRGPTNLGAALMAQLVKTGREEFAGYQTMHHSPSPGSSTRL